MKVLHLRAADGVYGAERVVLTLAKAQRARGIDAQVICIERPGRHGFSQRLIEDGIPVHRVLSSGRLDLGAHKEVRAIVEQERPSVLHAHDCKTDVMLAALRRCLPFRPALVATNHLWTRETPRLRMYERIDVLAMKKLDQVVGVSTGIRAELVEAGVPLERTEVIVNGLELGALPRRGTGRLRARLQLGPATTLFGFVGRLSVQKGLTSLLDAMERLGPRDVHLALIGDGPLRQELERQISARGLSRKVTLLGRREDATALMQELDVLVLPSVREGTPLVLLEAMSMGTPVIASAVGGVRELVRDGQTGLTVPARDPVALAKALCRTLEQRAERWRMASCAYDHVRARYPAEVMCEAYADLYARILETLDSPRRPARPVRLAA